MIRVKPQPEPSRGQGPQPRLPDPRVVKRDGLIDDMVVIDGIAYSHRRLGQILKERREPLDHSGCVPREDYWALAEEHKQAKLHIQRLQKRLGQADVHLKARTAALVRLIADTRSSLR